jgi:thymidine kinase
MNKLEELFIHFHNIPLFDLNTIDEIYIDEAQFFTDLYECIHILIHHYRKHVIIAGLDGDYTGTPFINGQLLHLIPLATTVVKLHSICYICGGYAPFTKRISDYKGQILIGGAELYAPTCLLCR